MERKEPLSVGVMQAQGQYLSLGPSLNCVYFLPLLPPPRPRAMDGHDSTWSAESKETSWLRRRTAGLVPSPQRWCCSERA